MTFPRARLAVSAVLFFGWIGFLLFLVIQSPAVLVSKPQILAANLIVVGEIREDHGNPQPQVKVAEVIWSGDPQDRELAGQIVNLLELPRYMKQQGYAGPGSYILPLLKTGHGKDPRNLDRGRAPPGRLSSPEGFPRQSGTHTSWDHRARVIEYLTQYRGLTQKEAEDLVDTVKKTQHVLVVRRWPMDATAKLERKLRDAGEVLGEDTLTEGQAEAAKAKGRSITRNAARQLA